MLRLSGTIAGLTAILALCKLSGAPFGWSWVLAPLALSVAIVTVSALVLGALLVLALIAAHRSEMRDGLLDDERDRFPGTPARSWRLHDAAAMLPRRQPVGRRIAS